MMKPFKAWAVVEGDKIACWNYRVPLYWVRRYAKEDGDEIGLTPKIVRVEVRELKRKGKGKR